MSGQELQYEFVSVQTAHGAGHVYFAIHEQPTVQSYMQRYSNISKHMMMMNEPQFSNVYDPKKIRNLHQFHNLKENMDAVRAYEELTLRQPHDLYVRTRSDNYFFTVHPSYFQLAPKTDRGFVIVPRCRMMPINDKVSDAATGCCCVVQCSTQLATGCTNTQLLCCAINYDTQLCCRLPLQHWLANVLCDTQS